TALSLLGITHLAEKPFDILSGGEQQLVIIARALAQGSRILLMDEPCANLDYSNQLQVLGTMRQLAEQGYLVIQTTHDPNHALQYSETTLLLQTGKLLAVGKSSEVVTAE